MVRRAVFALSLLLLLLPAPVLAADPAADATAPLAEDPAGDVSTDVAGSPQKVPAQARPNLDLRTLVVTDDPDRFHFTIGVTDLATGTEDAGDDGVLVATSFRHGAREFLIEIRYTSITGAGDAALLYRDDAAAEWSQLWARANGATLDATANTYSVDVERGDLADASGAAPYPGRVLDGFAVQADNLLSRGAIAVFAQELGLPGNFYDRLPDSGTVPKGFATAIGVVQEGHARLSSAEPYRSSNGEATTFTYTITAENTGEAADRFGLTVSDVPEGWSVTIPEPALELQAGAKRNVTILATVPFSHVHGAAASFVVALTSESDPASVGRLQMGVRYLAIPQPAGHHGVLHFHSQPYNQFLQVFGEVAQGLDGRASMNTLEDDPSDAGIPLSPQYSDGGVDGQGPTGMFSWCVALDPGLQMGLDFQVPGMAHVSVPLRAAAPITGAVLEASLLLVEPAANATTGRGVPPACTLEDHPGMVLAGLESSAPVDLAANSDGLLEGDLTMLREAERIDHSKGQNLLLYLNVRGQTPPNFLAPGSPRLLPGGTLSLPLLEYHDDVDAILASISAAGLVALGPQERLANPGATVQFPVSLANDQDVDVQVDLGLVGLNSAWAVLPEGPVEVPAHGTTRVDIVVQVPRDALAGDRADLLLQSFGDGGATLHGLLRFVVTVDLAPGLEDDAGLVPQAEAKDSPTGGLAVVLVAVGAAAVLRRRRA